MDKKKIYDLVLICSLVIIVLVLSFYISNNEKQEMNVEYNIDVLIKQKEVNYLYGVATAYCPQLGGINSDQNPEITSIGAKAKEGVIAVNPKVIPYNSEIMIISNNTVIRGKALDTGGAMRKNYKQVDILMENPKKAINWGRKNVHIIWW